MDAPHLPSPHHLLVRSSPGTLRSPPNTGDKLRGAGPGSSPAGPRSGTLRWGSGCRCEPRQLHRLVRPPHITADGSLFRRWWWTQLEFLPPREALHSPNSLDTSRIGPQVTMAACVESTLHQHILV